MEIKINVIEVASDLAHQNLLDEIRKELPEEISFSEEDLYEPGNSDLPDEGLIYKPMYQDRFNVLYDYYFEMISSKMDTNYFDITSVSRHDLEHEGYDTSNVDDDTMRRLASKMGDDYVEQLFWIQIPILAEYLGIPLKQEENEEN